MAKKTIDMRDDEFVYTVVLPDGREATVDALVLVSEMQSAGATETDCTPDQMRSAVAKSLRGVEGSTVDPSVLFAIGARITQRFEEAGKGPGPLPSL